MFESIFKFDRINFAEGSMGLQGGSAAIGFGVLIVFLVAALGLIYWSTNRFANPRDRAVSFGLRGAALLLLTFPLLEPVLIMPDVVPDENFVAVVVDASESMNVPDGREGETRWAQAKRLLFEHEDPIATSLEEHFKVRYYAFDGEPHRVDSIARSSAAGHSTNIAAALGSVFSDFRGLPLAGIVLLTDGADNGGEVPLNVAEELRVANVPLHVIGLGRESAAGDRELLEAVVHRGVEQTTGAEIDVKVRSWREEPVPVTINLYRGDDVVYADQRVLKGEGKVDQYTLYYEPDGPDPLEYTLRVEEAPDETNVMNNGVNVLIDPRQDTLRVLYLEGHPRRDFKFIKRALEDDEAVQITSILRTGTGKYYRQGIRHKDELAGGFPGSDEELFAFRAVIFGDIEAPHFSIEQLEMLERFVRLRGGGFAMLGGRSTFAEGSYWDNPIADLLPVFIDPDRREVVPTSFSSDGDAPEEQGYRFVPTQDGLESPVLRLAVDPSMNRARWEELPGLTSINYLGAVKPGGTVLAVKPEDDFGDAEPVFVVQRYGKGRSAALATASTWRWQMLMDAEDQRHERFWRQFVRWLAASAPARVDLDLDKERISPGEEVALRVNVYDQKYRPLSAASVHATLTHPTGSVQDLAMRADLGEEGSYTATLLPSEEGVYGVEVWAETDTAQIGRQSRSILVRASGKEYQDAVLKRTFLQHLADNAGGTYYDAADAGAIAENLRGRRTSTSVYRVAYLWDMPLFFILAVFLLSAEWFWRRRRGLP